MRGRGVTGRCSEGEGSSGERGRGVAGRCSEGEERQRNPMSVSTRGGSVNGGYVVRVRVNPNPNQDQYT